MGAFLRLWLTTRAHTMKHGEEVSPQSVGPHQKSCRTKSIVFVCKTKPVNNKQRRNTSTSVRLYKSLPILLPCFHFLSVFSTQPKLSERTETKVRGKISKNSHKAEPRGAGICFFISNLFPRTVAKDGFTAVSKVTT